MTVNSQLRACTDSLLAGMQAAERGRTPDVRAAVTLRACLDLVERLAGRPAVTGGDVDTALAVLERAATELGDEAPVAAHAVLAAVRNAAGRLQRLRSELEAG